MPQIKIHMARMKEFEKMAEMLTEIRASLVEVLGVSENIGQVMLYETPPDRRSIHSSRNINFIFIEITMYIGRTKKIKEELMERVTLIVNRLTAVDLKDINCCIYELEPENYFGGTLHKYIEDLERKKN